MPGIEKWFSRYAQLHSRVGSAHEYRPLAQEEPHFVLERLSLRYLRDPAALRVAVLLEFSAEPIHEDG